MASFKKVLQRMWDINGLVSDLKAAEWNVTEGPSSYGNARIDRMIGLPSYNAIEGMARDLLSSKEIKEAQKNDTLPELLSDAADQYINELAELVGEKMKAHVYGTFEDGDAWLGQYEEGKLKTLSENFKLSVEDIKRHGLERGFESMGHGAYQGEYTQHQMGDEGPATKQEREAIQEHVKNHLIRAGYSPGEAYSYVNAWVWDGLASWEPGVRRKILREINKAVRTSSAQMSGASMDGRGANDLATEFVNGGVSGEAGSMYIHGDRIYSYGPHFPIAERHGGAVYVTSRQSPSKTTSTHVNAVKRAAEAGGFDVVEKNIPPEV
jgi:hypothetical protein